MISKAKIKEVLNITLQTGADFGELFFEENSKKVYSLEEGIVSKINTGIIYGCGIRIMKKLECVYGYTNDLSYKGLVKLATTLKERFVGTQEYEVKPLRIVSSKNKNLPKEGYDQVPLQEQLDLLKEAYKVGKNVDPRIAKFDITYMSEDKNVTIYNTDGKIVKDRHVRGRAAFSAYAVKEGAMQTAFNGPGAQKGFEFFRDEIDVKQEALETAKSALTMLDAADCPAKVMPVVIDNGFGGVIFHEACGHGLEASSVSKKLSIFSDKLGQKVASDIVNAFDDGTIDGAWGSGNFDDEGNKTSCTQLIKNGVLINYLIDDFNGRAMNKKGNGACRRESYKFKPTSRMSNTFIANGTSTREEIIAATEYGLYAKKMGGGSVNPTTGDFNFAVAEGYMIEHGKITTPVKGATLIGNGGSILFNIDMIGNNLLRAQGMCGAESGSIAADVGQPTIRVSSITVGGTGGQ